MDKIRLVVYNEYALGYIMPQQPDKVCTLADRTTLGAPFRTMLEPYFIGKNDTVRLAGRKTSTRSGYRSRGTTIRKCTSMTPTNRNSSNQKINV